MMVSPLEVSTNSSSSWSQTNNTCYDQTLREQCLEAGGECLTLRDGFYTITTAGLLLGAVWFVWQFRTMRHLQTINPKEWRIVNKQEQTEDEFKYFYCF